MTMLKCHAGDYVTSCGLSRMRTLPRQRLNQAEAVLLLEDAGARNKALNP
jgi:hypothetical protein